MPAIRILLVDDHALVRDGLTALVQRDSGLTVVGDTGDPHEAVALAATTQPEIILLDLDLSGFDGFQVLPSLQAAAPSAAIIVITGSRTREGQARALQLGARGLVAKGDRADVLLKAIHRVRKGELWFDRAAVSSAVSNLLGGAGPAAPGHTPSLTRREREIIALVGEGLKNAAIAARLTLSEKTVRNHLTIVYEKLDVSDRLDLAIYAYRHGLARLPI